ncbi:hypothetical protein C8Q74DRAFT_1310683 [Fomes fomentarius]|nr:hypothetical protein C8Q74DRAFT_1310683 [Fomes fomentarius]
MIERIESEEQPEKRPTMDEISTQWKDFKAKLEAWVYRSRLAPMSKPMIEHVFKMCPREGTLPVDCIFWRASGNRNMAQFVIPVSLWSSSCFRAVRHVY